MVIEDDNGAENEDNQSDLGTTITNGKHNKTHRCGCGWFLRLVFPESVKTSQIKITLLLFFAMFGSSLTMAMVFPYLPRLIRDFEIDEVQIGTYAGIVASSFFVGRTMGSFFWGMVTDRYGRKSAILASNFSLALFTILFGLNWSFWWVTFARFMQGVVDGLIVAVKAAVSDISDDTNQGAVMGFIQSSFSFGLIIGPTLGGFLVLPHEQYPTVFSKDSAFGKYPYLLPNVVVFCLLMASLLLTYFYMPETFTRDESIEEKPLLAQFNNADSCSKEIHASNCHEQREESAFLQLIRVNYVRYIVLLHGVYAFVAIANDELFPLYAATPRSYYGLSFTTAQIGTALFIQTIPNIFIMIIIAPKLEVKFGGRKLYVFAIYLYTMAMPLIPCCSKLSNPASLWTVLILVLTATRTASSVGFLAVNIILNNSVKPSLLGAANGLGMTAGAFFRALSPAVVGSLFSWSLQNEGIGFPFNYNFSFLVMSFTAIMTLGPLVLIPKAVDQKWRPLSTSDEDSSFSETQLPDPQRISPDDMN